MRRTVTRRIACVLLTAFIGVLAGASTRQAARAENVLSPPLAPSTGPDVTAGNRNTFSLVEDDQLAAACWVANAGSCVCSAGAVEDLLTPDFMRVSLTNWRDTGRLTTRDWRERLQELDAACGSQSAAP